MQTILIVLLYLLNRVNYQINTTIIKKFDCYDKDRFFCRAKTCKFSVSFALKNEKESTTAVGNKRSNYVLDTLD